jgi:MSHA biogenesis protein MshN
LNPENSELRKLYARLMLNDQRFAAAIQLLKAEPVPQVANDLEYHALLAALFQESKQFEEAGRVYGLLVQARPQSALWWMGLAISQEQLGNSGQASDAYQRALNLPGLSPELENYIQSRLLVL